MQLILWVPLGRWNYQPCCPPGLKSLRQGTLEAGDAVGAAAFVLPFVMFWIGARREWRPMMWLAVVATMIWLGLQLVTWWPPYLFGASERWAQTYERAFSQSTPILPRWGNHLPPDAAHFVLQVLLSGAVISGVAALVRRKHAAS